MKFTLKALQLEFARILLGQATSDNHPPAGPVEPGEKVIGTIEDPVLRSLYSFHGRIAVYLEDYMGSLPESMGSMKPGELENHTRHVKDVMLICKMASKLLWANIMEQFPEAAPDTVQASIRDGWQLVIWKKDDGDDGFPIGGLISAITAIVSRAEREMADKKASAPATPPATPAPASSDAPPSVPADGEKK